MFLYVLLLIVHVVASIALVVSVLLQSSKGGGLAGTFGGSGISGGIFGGRGAAPFLTKATTAFAILFMVTSISLNFVKPGAATKSTIERAIRESGQGSSSSAVTKDMPMPQGMPSEENQGAVGENAPQESSTPENSPEGQK